MSVRVLITGSREIKQRSTVAAAITQTWVDFGRQPLTVIHGNARGADKLAGQVARDNRGRATEEIHPAIWQPEGPNGPTDKLAGFTRNQKMVDLGADICLAFLKEGERNSGTRDCIRRAMKAGINVFETWEAADHVVVARNGATR
ncbi:SLOG family protein [Leifsonia sp. Leaf264]|uniref:SLOG family protein n=1 Tax=Leifsonia sp. Leaf264 TaxID=1736314 RepID=UPI0006FDD7A1|nr:SLOG family protein [Leifsonia sp. Leaf264]KQO98890.1 hypothetical protein ASF30_12575 [Leifsonia sp. Leaf264]